jgi:release factor glutamine methyltransferase
MLQHINQFKPTIDLKILDIGCGTGVIGLALLSQLPHASCVAIDVNPLAVTLSERNSENLLTDKSRYNCSCQSFNDLLSSGAYINSFDIIVSNPPYISTADMPGLDDEVRLYEDANALDGGEDGMSLIRDIIANSDSLLKSESAFRQLWMEVDRKHPDEITRSQLNSAISVKSFNDFTGNPRFVMLKY